MYFRGLAMAMFVFMIQTSFGQHQSTAGDSLNTRDSLANILHTYGTFQGHFRSYTMGTVNHGRNPDYFAQAMGGGLAYYSPVIKRFQAALSGYIIYNVHSSRLATGDGYLSRYELGLFDITDPKSHEGIDRLETLYLRYYLAGKGQTSFIQVGKFHLNTPLLNMQDSRMRPNVQEGIWSEVSMNKHVQIKGGWLWNISPRGTADWYSTGGSVGVYPNGKAIDGTPAKYYVHVSSNGVGIVNITWTPVTGLSYQAWNYYAENLFNLFLHKAELRIEVNGSTLFGGIQHLSQRSISSHRTEVAAQYIGPRDEAHLVSARLGIASSSSNAWSANYTRITSHGRFLFPREWGTETLYTYITRERNEGSGDVHAWMIENDRSLGKDHKFGVQAKMGLYKMPSVANYRLNKYSMPSYYHIALKGRYKFTGFFQGLEAQALYVYKGELASHVSDEKYLHNKVKMHHAALVLDYHF